MKKASCFLLLGMAFLAVATTAALPVSNPRITRHSVPNARSIIETMSELPFFFTIPRNAMAPDPAPAIAPDRIIKILHPDSCNADNPIGLRVYKADSRNNLGARLATSAFVRTGDVLLTFRPGWAGSGPYANLQLGVSHTGIAYVANGRLYNIDNPLSSEFLDPNGNLGGEHYATVRYLHVIRPRALSDSERENLKKWATIFFESVFTPPGKQYARIYRNGLEFNPNYTNPLFVNDPSLSFVRDLGRIGLASRGAEMPSVSQSMYCSEFVWSLFALRGCDPEDAEVITAFQGKKVPHQIKPLFKPLPIIGSYALEQKCDSTIGLAEGPLLVLESMKPSAARRAELVRRAFPPAREGELPDDVFGFTHKEVAQFTARSGLFTGIEAYYNALYANPATARLLAWKMNELIPPNYSPSSFLLNALLPKDSDNRVFDYVGTIDLGECWL